MKKSTILLILALVALLIAVVCTGIHNYESTFVVIDGRAYDYSTTELDLSGSTNPDLEAVCQLTNLSKLDMRDTKITAEEYEQLRAALPDCEIIWQVPFGGAYLAPDTKELTIDSLSEEDLDDLKYFTGLESIRGTACKDLDGIMDLRERYPEVDVLYRVPVGGREVVSSTTYLQVKDPDIDELQKQLAYLTELKKVILTGTHPGNDAVLELENAYPDIVFQWNVQLLGKEYSNRARELDLSGIQLTDVSEVEAALKYFSNLELVNMSHCGLSNEEMDAFRKSQEKVKVVWSVPVRFFWVRTDAKYLMPYQYGCTQLLNSDAENLKYLTELECIDFGHMEITDLSFLYSMPNVKYLIIADCDIWDITPVGSLKKLEYLEMFLNKVSDISALAGCTELRDLNMCYNPVSDISPLLELKHLENLWAKGTYISWEKRQELVETFPNARIVTYSNSVSSTSEGWRQLPRYYEQRDFMGMWYTIEY